MIAPVLAGIVILAYITFVILIIIGGAFITRVLYNSSDEELSVVGIDNTNNIKIAKLTIVIFWITFLPLSIAPLVFCAGYCKHLF